MNAEAAAEQEESAPPIPETSNIRPNVSKPPVTKISVRGVPKSEPRAQCKFFLSKRGCTYGSDCKFLHQLAPDALSSPPPPELRDVGVKETSIKPRKSRPPVCRHYLSSRSGCKYGEKCRYRHPARSDGDKRQERRAGESEKETVSDVSTSGELSGVLCLSNFPGLGSAVAGNTRPVEQPPVTSSHTTHPSHPHKPHTKKHAPTDLSLGSFMTTPSVVARPHPPVSRPQRNKNKTNAELRQTELEQLETRFQGNHHLVEKGRERCVYLLTFAPTDPDWNFSFKTIELEVTFPHSYPTQPLTVNLPDDQGLHSAYVTHGNQAISHYLATASKGPGELMFRPFLRWLDKTITSVFKHAAKQVVATELFSGSGPDDETTPTEDHTPYTSEDEEGSEPRDSSDDGQLDEGSEVQHVPSLLSTEKRGTELRLNGLVMSDSVGVGRCASVRVTLQCTRCRGQRDETIRAESPASQLCSQCQHCFSFLYRPAMFHSTSPTLGFLDLHGCVPVDLILMKCETTLSCLECGRDNMTSGLNYGEHRDVWCKRCHLKLSVYIEQCRFIQHQPGATLLPTSAPSSKKSAKKREAIIQIGKPLPEFGTCDHYKKSHRWLRFPCCGKPYPCDTCHDLAEDHVMERANRMICGFCSREQTYTSTQPCGGCGTELVGGRAGAFWEGGKGCRNKTKMSRNDIHKYTNSVQKTHCKKQERVGKQATTSRTN